MRAAFVKFFPLALYMLASGMSLDTCAESIAVKKPQMAHVVANYLELLSIRIWLHQWSGAHTIDIPQFIPRDRLCSERELAKPPSWTSACVPARVELLPTSEGPVIEVFLAPGVNAELVLSELRRVLSNRDLGAYRIDESGISRIRREFEEWVKADPFLRNSQRIAGRVEAKTYPHLERLFDSPTESASTTLQLLQMLVETAETGDRSAQRIVLRFRPGKGFFNDR